MSGSVSSRRREAVVSLPRAYVPTPVPISDERFSGLAMSTILVLTLPLFAQSFHYLHELTVPYLLSKAWPLACLPLAIYGATALDLPAKRFYLVFLAYALGVTPFVSMLQLGNGLVDGMITTVKVWPLTYYFGLSALLVWLSPAPERLRAVLVGLGAATFLLLVLLWIAVPTSWYVNDPMLGKLFASEIERGYRIYMPMFFGALLLFYLSRRVVQRPNLLTALLILGGFIALLAIYKQRTAIGSMLLICLYAAVTSLAPRRRLLIVGLFLAVVPLGVGAMMVQNADHLVQSFGGSLTVRQNSLALAANFLGDDPWRWLFGVGATTRFGSITLADIFGNDQFYIADLGWFGVVFEYGLLGALLLAGLYVWGLFVVLKSARGTDDALVLALADYILYMLLTSAVYSLVFTPGELGVVMALAIYLTRARRPAPSAAPPSHRISFGAHARTQGD